MNDRLLTMKHLRDQKWSLQKIASKYGISRERVRQIIGNTGYLYKYPKLRREELVAVKKYFRLDTHKLATLYGVHFSLFNKLKLPHVKKYAPGFRRCYACKKILPYKVFTNRKFPRCKQCNAQWTYQFQKRTGYIKRYREQYKKGGKKYNHQVAYSAIHNALKKGILIKGPCMMKDKFCHGNIEAHHYLGYAKKHNLDVQWLCHYHHRLIDKNGFQKHI